MFVIYREVQTQSYQGFGGYQLREWYWYVYIVTLYMAVLTVFIAIGLLSYIELFS
ncbi:hypothetical protein [Bacillus cereus]|uniref:hypothetical protein n=1 Tax=Bacillus cereus TaxID=1396 RepID=UPI003D65CEB7